MAQSLGLPQADVRNERLPRWRRRERVWADKLNLAVDWINRERPGVPPPRQVFDSVSLMGAHFRVREEYADYCVGWKVQINPDNGEERLIAEPTYLAKPPSLRQSEYINEVYNTYTWTPVAVNERRSTNSADGSTEAQVEVPHYLLPDPNGPNGPFEGSLVTAVKGIRGGTLVAVYVAGPPQWCEWEIVDPRAFAKKTE
jgi:hypothetical protein